LSSRVSSQSTLTPEERHQLRLERERQEYILFRKRNETQIVKDFGRIYMDIASRILGVDTFFDWGSASLLEKTTAVITLPLNAMTFPISTGVRGLASGARVALGGELRALSLAERQGQLLQIAKKPLNVAPVYRHDYRSPQEIIAAGGYRPNPDFLPLRTEQLRDLELSELIREHAKFPSGHMVS